MIDEQKKKKKRPSAT